MHFHRQGKVGSIISTVRLSGMLSDSLDQPAARVWKIPLPRIPVTTRIIIFLVGDPYKPSFASVTGRGTTQDLFVSLFYVFFLGKVFFWDWFPICCFGAPGVQDRIVARCWQPSSSDVWIGPSTTNAPWIRSSNLSVQFLCDLVFHLFIFLPPAAW